jgi:hypothetical protein
MVLVLRPEDGKVMSVSRKKVLCHEEIYATFDATKGKTPIADIEAFKIDLDNVKVKGEVEGLNKIGDFKKRYNIPDHVLSVKFLDDYNRNPELNEANPTNPPRKIIDVISPQSTVQGENPVEMVDALNLNLLLEEMGRVKRNLKQLDAQDERAKAIPRALNKLEEELGNEAPRKGNLKRNGRPKNAEIDSSNIISPERGESIP